MYRIKRFGRRRDPRRLLLFLLGIAIAVVVFRLGNGSDAPKGVSDAVSQFYKMEQASDFGGAWELFHPAMKERFAKNTYIQDRNHIFMQHFGVTTFDYSIGKPELVKDWSMSEEDGSKVLAAAYKVPVRMHYRSRFGTFDLIQDVYVAQDDGDWRILWTYQ